MAGSGRHESDREDRPRAGDARVDEDRAGALVRRVRARSQLRAAIALEEAGELEEAARLFEYVGEHAEAAALRLEHATTIPDENARLLALRDGAAHNRGDSEQGRALHLALAKALLARAESVVDGAERRGLRLEAASALAEAGEDADAGDIYEALGLLARAARAYEDAGAIGRLEVVLALLDRREAVERELDEIERQIDEAMRTGRRRLARELVREHLRDRRLSGRDARAAIARLGERLERGLWPRRRLALAYRRLDDPRDRRLTVVGSPRLRIGRAPDCEFVVRGAALSREHVVVRVQEDAAGAPRLVLEDQGSRAGSFWNDEPLAAGEPVEVADGGELGLGIACVVELSPTGGPDRPALLLREVADPEPSTLYAPLGGAIAVAPGETLPADLSFDGTYAVLTAHAASNVCLEGVPLGAGARIELLPGDRLQLRSTSPDDPHPVTIGVDDLPESIP